MLKAIALFFPGYFLVSGMGQDSRTMDGDIRTVKGEVKDKAQENRRKRTDE